PFDFAQFWNPKMRGPICFNPAAVRSILPLTFKRTELVLSGMSKDQVIEGIKAFDAKGLPPLEPGAMCYMMSTKGYLNDSAGHWVRHLMFYVPLTDPKSWGADLPGTPVMLNPQFQGAPEPITEVMIPVPTWSDGTAAPKAAQLYLIFAKGGDHFLSATVTRLTPPWNVVRNSSSNLTDSRHLNNRARAR